MLAAQEYPLLQLLASHSTTEQLFLSETPNLFNSSRLLPFTALRCWASIICRVISIHGCTQLHGYAGIYHGCVVASVGVPGGCVVLPGDMQNRGIAGIRRIPGTDLERSVQAVVMAPGDSWVCSWLLWFRMGKSSLTVLGILISLHLQASRNGYAVELRP